MAGIRDADFILRDGSVDLTADETKTFTLSGGNSKQDSLAVHVLLPQDLAESGDTLKVTVKGTTTLHKVEVTHTDVVTQGTGTYPKQIVLPLPYSRSTTWDVVLDVTDSDAGGDFDAGAVQVWVGVLTDPATVDVTT